MTAGSAAAARRAARRGACVLGWLVFSACGSGGSSAPPTPTASTPVARAPWSMNGQIVATLGRAPVANAAIDALGVSAMTGSDGRFTLTRPTPPVQSFDVTVHADGYRTRETRLDYPRTTDPVIDITATAPPFNEDFYDQIARGTFEYPGTMYPLFRWETAPHIYLKTTDENGRPAPPEVVTLVTSALAEGVRVFSNGSFQASIESGTGERAPQTGWIDVDLRRSEIPDYSDACGLADSVGGNPNRIQLRFELCGCGSVKVPASVVVHEIGHTLGFFHVDDPNSIMYPYDDGTCRDEPLSRLEQTHVAVEYSRPRGNEDPDRDPSDFSLLVPTRAMLHGPGPVR